MKEYDFVAVTAPLRLPRRSSTKAGRGARILRDAAIPQLRDRGYRK